MIARYANKVVVVTGGSSGIGFATCRRLLDEGAHVVMAARRSDLGASAAAALDSDRVIFHATDVTDRAQLESLFAATVEQFGRLDVLVNNAGVTAFGPVDGLAARHWQRLISTNLTALFDACQAVAPHMRRTIAAGLAATTAIVNVASLTAVAGEPGMAAYSAAKAGALNFTRSLALEWIRDGIRVNAISPGAIDTPMAAASTGDARIAAAFTDSIPIGRFGLPQEIAAAIAFLGSDDASFIVGANLLADGGVTAATGHPNLMKLFAPES